MNEVGPAAGTPSVGIVGAGIIGLSTAWRLAQRHVPVTVFDKGNAGAEASWAGAGMLSPGGEVDQASPLAKLLAESRDLYGGFVQELEQAAGVRIDYQECGALELAYTPEEADCIEARAQRQTAIGINSKPISPEQVAAFWPRVQRQGLAGARFYPGDAIIDPREIVAALKIACRRLGVEITENCAVRALEISQHRADVITAQGKSSFAAGVIAAGAWSSSLQVKGVPALPSAEPVKGHLVGYRQPEQTCNTILRHRHSYVLQRANGLLIAGASEEHVGFNRDVDRAVAATLAMEAALLLPHLGETTPTEVWTGFRPGSDELRLGRWHSDRLYTAYGHYRNGILLAPVTAALLAEQITSNLRTS